MKFKVGDRVKHSFYGKGTIIEIDSIGSPLVEFDKSRDNFHGGGRKQGKDGHCWYTDMIKPLKSQTIVIYPKGLETIALLKEGNKIIKQASAKCSPSDVYDYNIGAKLAFDRLMGRVEQSRPNTIIKQDKYEVGDKVRLRSDLKANTRYGDVKLLPCMLNFAKGDVTIDKIWGGSNYIIKDCDFIWSEEMFEGKVIDATSVREVKRPAKVGEWIKIVETKEPCYGYLIGDVLQVKKVIKEYGTIEKPYWIASCEYVVLENYQPEATKTLSDYTDKELIDEPARRWEDKK